MKENIFSVKDKIIVISGGMGQLGLQFSKSISESGGKVVILDIESDKDVFIKRFGSNFNDKQFEFIKCDITNKKEIEQSLVIIKERWGRPPFGLINNAALDSPPNSTAKGNEPFEEYPEESWDKVMSVNAKGPFLLCQVFGNEMAKSGEGSIVNVSSIYGLLSPDQSLYKYRRDAGENFYKPVAYSASKSALFNFTRYLATYWAKSGVRINTLVLGGVFNDQDQEFLSLYNQKIPIGRMANENEYNGAILFLLSEASEYMTGSSLTIDGGWSAW